MIQKRSLSAMFSSLSEVERTPNGNGHARQNGHAPSLEDRLRVLNRRLLDLNERISGLEHERDSVRVRLVLAGKELQRLRATQVKQAVIAFQRTDIF